MEGRTEVPQEFVNSRRNGPPGASNKQLSFLSSLASERDIEDDARKMLKARIAAQMAANEEQGEFTPCDAGIAKSRASDFIERLLTKPKVAFRDPEGQWAPVAAGEDEDHFALRKGDTVVPRGSYAIPTADLGGEHVNETNFYSVWVDKREGEVRWSVKQLVSEDRIKMPRSAQYKVLDVIGKDPAAAATAYGLLIGKCGICGRGLTNDESRERGIGPVCADRWGW